MAHYTILHRRGSQSEWSTANPTLLSAQLGFEPATNRWKVGNGTPWAGLEYFPAGRTKPHTTTVTALQATVADGVMQGSATTAFSGDISKIVHPIDYRISGTYSLKQPTTGYEYTPEAYPYYTYLTIAPESGFNYSTTTNDGRTAACANRVRVFHAGGGDAAAFNASVYVNGTRPGSTHWLANPAGVLFNGDLFAGADGAYLNPFETHHHDNGYDAACVGIVSAFYRENETGAKSAIWHGARMQSMGTASCDAMYTGAGEWKTGLDFAATTLDFGVKQAAVSLRAGQRIYLNNTDVAAPPLDAGWHTTVFNNDYLVYDTDKIVAVVGNNPSLQVTTSGITVAGDIHMPAGAKIYIDNVQVVP